jgi:hypothetical protein
MQTNIPLNNDLINCLTEDPWLYGLQASRGISSSCVGGGENQACPWLSLLNDQSMLQKCS